jgi:hypothetical protein
MVAKVFLNWQAFLPYCNQHSSLLASLLSCK